MFLLILRAYENVKNKTGEKRIRVTEHSLEQNATAEIEARKIKERTCK